MTMITPSLFEPWIMRIKVKVKPNGHEFFKDLQHDDWKPRYWEENLSIYVARKIGFMWDHEKMSQTSRQ